MTPKIAPILDESSIDWHPYERAFRVDGDVYPVRGLTPLTLGVMTLLSVGMWLAILGALILIPPEAWPW